MDTERSLLQHGTDAGAVPFVPMMFRQTAGPRLGFGQAAECLLAVPRHNGFATTFAAPPVGLRPPRTAASRALCNDPGRNPLIARRKQRRRPGPVLPMAPVGAWKTDHVAVAQ